jgi:hypothetical protein
MLSFVSTLFILVQCLKYLLSLELYSYPTDSDSCA